MNILKRVLRWYRELAPLLQASVIGIFGGIILIVLGFLIGLFVPSFAIGVVMFGLLALNFGWLFLSIRIGIFVYRKLKP